MRCDLLDKTATVDDACVVAIIITTTTRRQRMRLKQPKVSERGEREHNSYNGTMYIWWYKWYLHTKMESCAHYTKISKLV